MESPRGEPPSSSVSVGVSPVRRTIRESKCDRHRIVPTPDHPTQEELGTLRIAQLDSHELDRCPETGIDHLREKTLGHRRTRALFGVLLGLFLGPATAQGGSGRCGWGNSHTPGNRRIRPPNGSVRNCFSGENYDIDPEILKIRRWSTDIRWEASIRLGEGREKSEDQQVE
jgi:hypothetical protein